MTVDELLDRMTASELGEWQYLLDKEHEVTSAVRQGVDLELAQRVAFEDKEE